MKAVKFLAVVLLGIFITSCDDSLDNHDQLTMGNESGMKITNLDTIIKASYPSSVDYLIDIDKNGTADIQITSTVWGSPAIGAHPGSFIKSLNSDFQLYGNYSNDTVFYNFSISATGDPDAYYTLIHGHKYSCSRIDSNDSIISIQSTFKTPPLDKGSTISKEDPFRSEKAQLIDDSYIFPPSSYSINPDTVIGVFTTYLRECNNFPIGSAVYIGFRNTKKSKMGWIKFIFIDEYKLWLLETAIQK